MNEGNGGAKPPQGESGHVSRVRRLVQSRGFNGFIALLVFVDGWTICLDADARARALATPAWAQIVSIFCLVLYTFELALKLAVGFGLWGQKLNLFIILTGYLEIILSLSANPSVLLSVLRAVRCVRIIKLLASLRDAGLSSLTQLENIMLLCMKDLFWSSCLCFLIMTSFAYLFVEIINPLYQSTDVDFPVCEHCHRATSSIMDANLFLFQTVVVGDNWGEVALPVINNFPGSAALLIGAYLTIVFGLLNLIIAVVVNSFQNIQQGEEADELEADETSLQKIFQEIDVQGDGKLNYENFLEGAAKNPDFKGRLGLLNIKQDDLRDLFQRMDVDGKQLINAQQFSRVLRSYNRHGKYDIVRCILRQEDLAVAIDTGFSRLTDRMDNLSYKVDEVLAKIESHAINREVM